DSRKQHRADDRVGQRLGGGRRRLHDPGDPPDGLRPRYQSGGDPGDGRRLDGDPDDDPAAPRLDREGARHADLPRGDGLRGSADRRRRTRPAGKAGVPGVRRRLPLQVPDGRAQAVARRARQGLRVYPGAAIATEISPELLGGGYIIGPRIAGYLFAGGCFAYLVLAPAIKPVGSRLTEPFGFPAVKLIRDMSPGEIRASFVFYIGAGAVASAGIIALARSLPTILS